VTEKTLQRRVGMAAGLVIVVTAVLWWRAGEKVPPRPAIAPATEAAAVSPAAPAPPAAPRTPPARPRPPDSAAAARGAMEEDLLMRRLRALAKTDSAQAITLAEEGNRRFPDSAAAPERESILIHSLASAERRSEARGRAEFMVNHYPDSEWVREIERFSGAHRHRNLSVNDAGQLIVVP
jgi:hypothetical protein